ncbi:uncharacterized protein LOC114537206 [Dendronephthya gigantea]|uniref:uncharacterized protein LOC114537206 n=1 Tax=Dendronephthya gigantea TaxID=151771 RepID=UPI00106ABF60|nr:uncharacterized protein LOC114537206 [Dendronephthya gigantea]
MSAFRALGLDFFLNFGKTSFLTRSVVHFHHHRTRKIAAFSSYFRTRTQSSYAGLANNKKFLSGFEELPELEGADENVRRIFSLDNASQQQKRKVLNKELMKVCKTPKEREIAEQTISIANLEEHLQRTRNKDKHNKVFLQWLKDQRMKKLKSIKTSDFERYIVLVKQLDIEPLESTHTKYAKYKFRKFKIGVEIKEKRSLAVRKTPSLTKKINS